MTDPAPMAALRLQVERHARDDPAWGDLADALETTARTLERLEAAYRQRGRTLLA